MTTIDPNQAITTTCPSCQRPVRYDPNPGHTYPDDTRYWKQNTDGTVVPYCNAQCGLDDYKEYD